MLENIQLNLQMLKFEEAHKIINRLNKSFALFTSQVLEENFIA